METVQELDLNHVPKPILKALIALLFSLVSLLGVVNIYFVNGLVDELHKTRELVISTRQELAVLTISFEDFKTYSNNKK